jgi:hypothetical protein
VNYFVDPKALVYAPGTRSANINGYANVLDLINEANASLLENPVTIDASRERSYQEALKTGLDTANNDRSFVQPTPSSCPEPIFAAPTPEIGL